MKGRNKMSRNGNLPAKCEQKNIYSKQLKYKNIDINNILKITPNQLFNVWNYNREITRRHIVEIQGEIRGLNSELKHSRKNSRIEKINMRINDKKLEIANLDKNLKLWLDNAQHKVNVTVKQVFQKLISNATDDQINDIIMEFGNVFSKPKYADTTLENILINFITEYKNRYSQLSNYPVNIVNKMVSPMMQHINKRKELVQDDSSEYNDVIDNYNRNFPDNYKDNNVNSNDMRYFSVSIFYSSLGKKPKMNTTGKRSFELMMLGALDTMSNLLYGNLQNALSSLYEKIDEKDIIDVPRNKK